MFAKLFPMVLVLTIIAVTVQAQEFATDGLLGFWSFDRDTIAGDVLQDLWGDNPGTIVGDPELVAGKINEALEFNGASDCVELPDMGEMEAVSVEVWLSAIALDTNPRGLVSSFPADQWKAGTVHFKYKPDGAVGICADKQDGDKLVFPEATEEDRWYHAAYTCDTASAEFKLYVDGELVAEGVPGATPNNLTHIRFASEHDGRYFQGMLDEVRIYERILSEAEVKHNFEVESNAMAIASSDKLTTTWASIKARG